MEDVIPRTSLRRGNFAQYALITISLIFLSPRRSLLCFPHPGHYTSARPGTHSEAKLSELSLSSSRLAS